MIYAIRDNSVDANRTTTLFDTIISERKYLLIQMNSWNSGELNRESKNADTIKKLLQVTESEHCTDSAGQYDYFP